MGHRHSTLSPRPHQKNKKALTDSTLLAKPLKRESRLPEVHLIFKWHPRWSQPRMKLIWPNNWRKRNRKMQRFRVMMMKKKNKSEWAARLDLMVMRAMRKTVIKIKTKTVPVVSEEDMIKRARKYPVLYFTCWINK